MNMSSFLNLIMTQFYAYFYESVIKFYAHFIYCSIIMEM